MSDVNILDKTGTDVEVGPFCADHLDERPDHNDAGDTAQSPTDADLPRKTVRDVFSSFSAGFEGRIHWMYVDIKGLVTVGIGNLIDPESLALALPFVTGDGSSPATEDEIRDEWRMLKSRLDLRTKGYRACEAITQLRLTDESIDDLILAKFDGHEAILRRAFPEWDTWPADARLGAHSIVWAGAGFPDQWPKFGEAVRSRDWSLAAEQCHLDANGNEGLIARNTANELLFRNAAVVEATGLDVTTLYYPQQL